MAALGGMAMAGASAYLGGHLAYRLAAQGARAPAARR